MKAEIKTLRLLIGAPLGDKWAGCARLGQNSASAAISTFR
jgi:hypothetical protein